MTIRCLKNTLRRCFDSVLGPRIDSRINHYLLYHHLIVGNPNRLSISPSAIINNALFNTVSGRIVVEGSAFFGHNVCLLTGTHDVTLFGRARQASFPDFGRDIIIRDGVWIASNATVIGPCEVGEHAVVAAGSVVLNDVPPFAIVGGVPARILKYLKDEVNDSC